MTEPILRATENTDWITLLIFGSLVCLILAKGLFYNRFLNFILLPFNNKYIFVYNKKEKLISWFHIFFTTFQIINLSLFLFFIWKIFGKGTYENHILVFTVIFFCVFAFSLLKYALQYGNAFIFGSQKNFVEILFNRLSYLNHSGIVMFLANIVLAYVLKDMEIVIYIAILLILSINAMGWVNVLRIHQNFIAGNFFYFILYLCALEIAPLIILGSYIKHGV